MTTEFAGLRRRRQLIATVALLAVPLMASAQVGPKTATIGFLSGSSASAQSAVVAAFKERLAELGYGPGRYVLETRYAEGYDARLPELASDLVRLKSDVILTVSPPAALAAARATSTIPIVFVGVGDPVGSGLIPNPAHPPRNITGVTLLAVELAAKRLELLKEAVPRAARVGIIWNPNNPVNVLEFKEAQAAAAQLGITVVPFELRSPDEIDTVLASAKRTGVDAVWMMSSPVTFQNRQRITGYLVQNGLPAICALREYAVAGCLVSYGPSYVDHFRRAAAMIDKVLKGATPLPPVEQPTQFELVVNPKTAAALGLTVPQRLLVRAELLD